jgi:hypothetical protein
MERRRTLSFLTVLAGPLVFLAVNEPLVARPASSEKKAEAKTGEKKGEEPSAGKQLLLAAKKLSDATSYEVALRVEGGLSNNAEHRLDSVTVRQSYRGGVYRNEMMHVPQMKVYRTARKGVYATGRSLLSDREGVLMDRLFSFPLDIVSKASKNAKQAQWVRKPVAEERSGVIDLSDDDEDSAEGESVKEPDAGKKPGSRTVVVKPNQKTASAAPMPRFVRVEAPPKEAVEHFVTVEKSGCFGGG